MCSVRSVASHIKLPSIIQHCKVEDLAEMGRIPEHFITARLRLPVVKRNGRGLATPSGDLPFTLPLLVADDASVYLPASDFVCLPPLSGSQSGPGLRPHLSLSFIAPRGLPFQQTIRGFRLIQYQPCRTSVVAFSHLAEFVSEIQSGARDLISQQI